MENSSGPKTEPWGTPRVSGTLVEVLLCTRMNCCLSVRYDLNHCKHGKAIPEMVYHASVSLVTKLILLKPESILVAGPLLVTIAPTIVES